MHPLATYDQLVNQLRFPGASQAAYDAARMKFVEDALTVRPYFLPIIHTLPAAASNTPVSQATEPVKFPLIIHGVISDGEDRDIRYYINNQRKNLIGFGSQPNLRLSLEALAGHPVAIAGYAGVQRLISPMPLDAYDYLTLEMYQDAAPGVAQLVTTCFTASRAFTPADSESKLTPELRAIVRDQIRLRPAPLTTYDVVPVAFANQVAETETPQDNDPYLIHGFRSTFTDAMISIGYDSQRGFSKDPFPIWAIAAEGNNSRQVWQMLKTPLFMAPQETLLMNLRQTIDGVNFATNGNIEILRTSV